MKYIKDIIVFSHLRWNFVYQRPQHLLERLAAGRRVIYIEEPVYEKADPHFRVAEAGSNVIVCTPVLPDSSADSVATATRLQVLLDELMRDLRPSDYALWFYTPMALPQSIGLKPRITIYDCMDELSAFLNAPPELLAREEELLQRADLVFTGGPSLYRSKKNRHPRVHCLPSSVDLAHFSRARGSADHPLQSALAHPRLGYFGVIDERLDLDLLRALAESHPDWQVVMVGPVVKIDPATLPQAPNLHYLGQQQYADLPALLGGWDVCMMPFALNEATRHISPTKTLEYMAGEKLIVSTAITDVEEPYGDSVYVAHSHQKFIDACSQALSAPEGERNSRLDKMRAALARTSWQETAARMEELMEEAAAPQNRASVPRPATPLNAGTVVIGAGPTGLSAAYHLGNDYALLERNSTVGGWCRSLEVNGFTFDYAGHIMFSNEPYVHELYQMLLGENVHWQDREAWIYSKNVYTRYPFQGALHGLPPQVIQECLMGAIQARFGKSKPPQAGVNGHAKLPSNGNGTHREFVKDCCADGILEASAGLGANGSGPPAPRNFEEFIYNVWGAGIAKHFAIPYNRKLWAVPLDQMETSWLGGRVPLPDIEEMIEGALSPARKPVGPNARFGYPLRGGFQKLMDGFLPHLKGDLHLHADVKSISPRRHKVVLSSGLEFGYDRLISTMPLPALIRSMGADAPAEVRDAAQHLRHTSVCCVHIGVGRSDVTGKHWIYYPEDTVFHRIFVQGNASPFCNPPGGFGFTCEITYGAAKPMPCQGEDLIELCIRDARRVGFIREDDPVLATAVVDLPCAYVIYDHGRAERVSTIRQWLREHGIILAGRYSEWEYYNSDHAFIAGKKAAEEVLSGRQVSNAPALNEWNLARK